MPYIVKTLYKSRRSHFDFNIKTAVHRSIKLIAKTVEKFRGENKKLYISHADCKDDADYLSHMLEEKLGIKTVKTAIRI